MADELKPLGLDLGSDVLLRSRIEQAQNKMNALGQPKGKDPKAVEKAATDFEALLLQQMFKSMWTNVPSEGLISGSSEEGLYRDMLNDALSKSVAENQSIGVKDVVLRELSAREAKAAKNK